MFFRKEKFIQLGIIVVAALIVVFLFWYVAQRKTGEMPDTTLQKEEIYDPLGRNPNPRSLTSQEIEEALEGLGRNPEPRRISEEEKQRSLDSLGRTGQEQE